MRYGNTANALVADTETDIGGGACFNDARVEIEKAPVIVCANRQN